MTTELVNGLEIVLDDFSEIQNFDGIEELEAQGLEFEDPIDFLNTDGLFPLKAKLYKIRNCDNATYNCIGFEEKSGSIFLQDFEVEMGLNELK